MADTVESKTKKADKKLQEAKAAEKEARAEALKAKAERLKAETRFIGGFMEFIRQQGIVGLAIGLAIGTQANATVKSIVDGFISPIVGFIVGSNSGLMAEKWYMVGQDTKATNYLFTLGSRQLVFSWGQVLSSLITLIAVAAVIYFVIKGLRLDKIDTPKP